jgi:GntR family transcriptional regulator / MocR family aminotransferase
VSAGRGMRSGRTGSVERPHRAPSGRIVRIEIDHASPVPLYRQVYAHLRAAILDGRLLADSRLPSTRTLSRDLRVSRGTIILAYDQLEAEGYVEGTQGAATRVRGTLPDSATRAAHAAPSASSHADPSHEAPPFAGRVSRLGQVVAEVPLAMAHVVGRAPRAFRAGVPAVDVFPVETWGRLLARRWRRSTAAMLAYGDPFGFRPLREAIAHYVVAARGVRCDAEQVVVVAGSQQGIDLAARVLLDPGHAVWLEDPGYFGARGALLAAGARLVPVPVDESGLDVAAGRAAAPDARMAHVTPSRQLPLGMTMSLARRLALLEWAAGAGAWVFEDDYDSEFRYASQPLSALQGLDAHGCVVYAGTFSKVMFPAMRLGYIVVPHAALDAFRALRIFTDYHSPYLEQAVMADFMAEGHFERHIRRMRAVYAERQAALLAAARAHLSEWLTVVPADAGLTLVGWLPEAWDDRAVARAAADAEIDVLPISAFCLQRRLAPGLLLGYSGVRSDELEAGARRLAAVLRAYARSGPQG